MTDDASLSVTNFFDRLRAGDAAAAEPLWRHFFTRLTGLARKALLCDDAGRAGAARARRPRVIARVAR